MRSMRILLSAALLLLAAPATSHADAFEVQYTLTGGSFSFGLSPSTVVGGTARFRVEGPGSGPVSSRFMTATQVSLQSFRATLTGPYSLTVSLTAVPFPWFAFGSVINSGPATTYPFVSASGPLSGLLAGFGTNSPNATTGSAYLTASTVLGTLYGTVLGGVANFSLTFTGQEVSSAYFVPEPSSGWLVGLGLAGVALAMRRARTRG